MSPRRAKVWRGRNGYWWSLTSAEMRQFPAWQLAFRHALKGATA